ncbi:hypothetical protein ACFX19_022735 [Malus domestica]
MSTSVLRGKANWQKCPTFTCIRENTPNKIAFSKIEEAQLSESREPDSQKDYLLKNRRGTSIRIEEAHLSESREPDSSSTSYASREDTTSA